MPAPPAFRYRHRVTYAECTVGNHIYHSRYLDLLEAARGEFLRHLGFPLLRLQEAGIIFPVIDAHLRYLRPARYDDELAIEVSLIRLDGIRLGVRHRVFDGNERLLVEAETLHVCTSVAEKPRRLPPDLLEALRPWLTSETSEDPEPTQSSR